jgi:plastocyanin
VTITSPASRVALAAILVTLAGSRVIAQDAGAGSATLSGKVSLMLPPKVKIDPGGSVVWIPGLNVSQSAANANSALSVTSKDKRFEPRILAVSAGTRVTFPNLDSIYHNAFSLTPGNQFDVGLYRKGASRDVVLKNPGIVRVYCNIHPDMAASVVVVGGNAFAVVRADGGYRITGIPPGRHEVHIWSDVAGEQVVPMNFASGQSVDWSPSLDATKYQRVAHTNKHGKAYPKAKNDADRY